MTIVNIYPKWLMNSHGYLQCPAFPEWRTFCLQALSYCLIWIYSPTYTDTQFWRSHIICFDKNPAKVEFELHESPPNIPQKEHLLLPQSCVRYVAEVSHLLAFLCHEDVFKDRNRSLMMEVIVLVKLERRWKEACTKIYWCHSV